VSKIFKKPPPTPPRAALSEHQRVQADILAAMQQDFPIRGWHLSSKFMAPPEPYAYPVHSDQPELDSEGLPKEKPPVLFHVESRELVLTADFRLEACKVLGGQSWTCPQTAIDQQWIRFANTNGSLEIILDTKNVPPFQEKLIYPKQDEWAARVAWWAKKWTDSGKNDNQARWVLVQLDGIRNSANHMLHQSLGRLVDRISKLVPDYWLLAELAMANRLEDEMGQQALRALRTYGLGQGAFTVRTFQRPTGPPTETVQ
jgi:hypothetical protein